MCLLSPTRFNPLIMALLPSARQYGGISWLNADATCNHCKSPICTNWWTGVKPPITTKSPSSTCPGQCRPHFAKMQLSPHLWPSMTYMGLSIKRLLFTPNFLGNIPTTQALLFSPRGFYQACSKLLWRISYFNVIFPNLSRLGNSSPPIVCILLNRGPLVGRKIFRRRHFFYKRPSFLRTTILLRALDQHLAPHII